MMTYCIFLSHGILYAIPTTEIRIVPSSYPINSIPTSNHYIKGLMNIYGDIYTAIQLEQHTKISVLDQYCIVLKNIHIGILCEYVELIESDNIKNDMEEFSSLPSFVAGFLEIKHHTQFQAYLQSNLPNVEKNTHNIWIIDIEKLQMCLYQQSV